MGVGLGAILLISAVLIVVWAVRRTLEGAALRKAQALAAAGQHDAALREALTAERRWSFNTAHDVRSTRVAALDRLEQIVRFTSEQVQAIGRPIDSNRIMTLIRDLRLLLGTKEHYKWGNNQALEEPFKGQVGPLMAQLELERKAHREACSVPVG